MATLAEAYVRLKPYYIIEERLNELGRATDQAARETAQRIFPFPVQIEVELIEGTLTGKIKIFGTILIGALGAYASIGGAIDTTEKLCKWSKSFSQIVCDRFIDESGAKPGQVQGKERRLGDAGAVLRALKRIERLDNTATDMNKDQLQLELHNARRQLESALHNLTAEEANTILKAVTATNLPPVHEWPTKPPLVGMPKIARYEAIDLPTNHPLTFKHQLMSKLSDVAITKARQPLRYHNIFVAEPVQNRDGGTKGSSIEKLDRRGP